MKYLCLVYLDESLPHPVADSECLAYDAAIRAGGQCIASEALESVNTATTVRVRNGRTQIIDGPFAETKEQLAGFYLIDAIDLNEALLLAAQIPPARAGSIEVRPVRPIRELASSATAQHGVAR
ncbi:MAG: YciI family protein [Afipia sp.]|jgi:hypothetical protein|nr:YciI family protein [Afipia sp.]